MEKYTSKNKLLTLRVSQKDIDTFKKMHKDIYGKTYKDVPLSKTIYNFIKFAIDGYDR